MERPKLGGNFLEAIAGTDSNFYGSLSTRCHVLIHLTHSRAHIVNNENTRECLRQLRVGDQHIHIGSVAIASSGIQLRLSHLRRGS